MKCNGQLIALDYKQIYIARTSQQIERSCKLAIVKSVGDYKEKLDRFTKTVVKS